MPHVEEEEKKDDMFRSIGDTVDAVGEENEDDDGPQVMDNIGILNALLPAQLLLTPPQSPSA